MVKPEAAIVDVCFAVFLFLDELCVEISAGKRLDSHKAATMCSTIYHIILLCAPFAIFFKFVTIATLKEIVHNLQSKCYVLLSKITENNESSIIGFIATTVLNESGKHILNESAGKEKRNMWVKQCSGREGNSGEQKGRWMAAERMGKETQER